MLIVVPTDFSSTAANAVQYAWALANALQGKVLCLNAYAASESEENVAESFAAFFQTYQLPITETLAIKGGLEAAVAHCQENYPVALLVMGTKGAQGLGKILGTSHTTDVLSSTTIPVLVLPEKWHFQPYQYIMWASDFQFLDNDDALDILVALAQHFEAEVRIAHVKTTDKHGTPAEHLERRREKYVFDSENVKYSFKRIHSANISKGIQYYLDLKGDNDLLVLVRRKHGFMSRVFRTDHAMAFAASPKVPILILHDLTVFKTNGFERVRS